MTRYERDEQRDVAAYLDARGLLYSAIPLGGHKSRRMGANRRSQGAKPGVPDLLIFDVPPARPRARGVAIELKRANLRGLAAGQPSDDQQRWLTALEARGWVTAVCYGAREAVRLLRELGW